MAYNKQVNIICDDGSLSHWGDDVLDIIQRTQFTNETHEKTFPMVHKKTMDW